MKRPAKLSVNTTIKLVYEAFIENIISFHLAITFKYLSAEDIKELNHQINIAYKLSGKS